MSKKRNIIITFLESVYGALTPNSSQEAQKSQQAYQSFRAKALSQRSAVERVADNTTAFFGSISFAFLHVIWFGAWVMINLGYIEGLEPFDPYPFGLLTMLVSLEAIFLSTFVLISQNRESQISTLREEVDFQINMHAEQEITKVMEIVHDIHDHLGLSKQKDRELEAMKEPLDPLKLEQEIKAEEKSN
jgi:uncharacterized membrane protein